MNSPLRGRPLIVLAMLMAPVMAMAQQKGERPPAPDFGAMAQALGVSESAMKSCMPEPAKGQRPEKPNATSVAGCLQATKPDVTSAQVDEVLRRFGPGGGTRKG